MVGGSRWNHGPGQKILNCFPLSCSSDKYEFFYLSENFIWMILYRIIQILWCVTSLAQHCFWDSALLLGIVADGSFALLYWPPHAKSWLIGKDSAAGRDWGQEEKGTTEDEMAGWHHWLDGRESEWTPGVGDGQGGLACGIHGVSKSPTWLRDWTELVTSVLLFLFKELLAYVSFWWDSYPSQGNLNEIHILILSLAFIRTWLIV